MSEQTPTRGLAISLKTPPDVGPPPGDAQTTPSGLTARSSWGERRTTTTFDRVTVHYAGWTKDGALLMAQFNGGRRKR